jgi:hypothetical protein
MSWLARARGVSLLELCLVLAIIASAVTVVLRYAHTTQASGFFSQAQTGWSEMVAATDQWRHLHHSYANVTVPALMEAGLLPGECVIKATQSAQSWTVSLNKLPPTVCHHLQQLWAHAADGECQHVAKSMQYKGTFRVE